MIMLSRRLAIVVLTSMPLSGMLAPAWTTRSMSCSRRRPRVR